MNASEQSDPRDDQLRSMLHEWVVDRPLPPRFQEEVWRRIARTEALAPGWSARLWHWLEAALPRPKIALSYMAALLLLGIAAGSVTAQLKSTHLNAALGQRYVHSIDPYLAELPQP